ncbi:general secretion pathway protein GspC [Pseudomonas sp. MPFS]|uniref:type II secretion system protein N n=1 Tax=Pseudomonas sp. MPFS TaxID=2795724 RepID=UPI001F1472D8|nr:type II secretion system protein N [Pseudomonas sp. MPFS]UMZ09345.1 general secretion pathway protein GspC [Pseudomonas sp. MPFS]
MPFALRFSVPQVLQYAALLVALAGVGTWSSLLLTPAESRTPTAAPQAQAARSDSPALQWFANQPVQVDIKVSGVMAGARGAVAILSLNDGPPRSFLAGERLTQGVQLVAVEADGVLIERGGQRSQVKVSKLPDSPSLPRLTR